MSKATTNNGGIVSVHLTCASNQRDLDRAYFDVLNVITRSPTIRFQQDIHETVCMSTRMYAFVCMCGLVEGERERVLMLGEQQEGRNSRGHTALTFLTLSGW